MKNLKFKNSTSIIYLKNIFCKLTENLLNGKKLSIEVIKTTFYDQHSLRGPIPNDALYVFAAPVFYDPITAKSYQIIRNDINIILRGQNFIETDTVNVTVLAIKG